MSVRTKERLTQIAVGTPTCEIKENLLCFCFIFFSILYCTPTSTSLALNLICITMLFNRLYAMLAVGAALSQAALLPREEEYICGKNTYLKFPSCCNKTPSAGSIWSCDIERAAIQPIHPKPEARTDRKHNSQRPPHRKSPGIRRLLREARLEACLLQPVWPASCTYDPLV